MMCSAVFLSDLFFCIMTKSNICPFFFQVTVGAGFPSGGVQGSSIVEPETPGGSGGRGGR